MAPKVCIEYVVVHELCHSVVPHHGPKFEALLTRCLPDWRERKARLETTAKS
jgi:predicted metal-dependent hydrolase